MQVLIVWGKLLSRLVVEKRL